MIVIATTCDVPAELHIAVWHIMVGDNMLFYAYTLSFPITSVVYIFEHSLKTMIITR